MGLTVNLCACAEDGVAIVAAHREVIDRNATIALQRSTITYNLALRNTHRERLVGCFDIYLTQSLIARYLHFVA